MSASKWAYLPERCDGEPCPGDCDVCSKTQMDGMTTERAITLLDELRQCYGWGDVIIHSDDAEALTMAIEALERDRWIPCEEPPKENGAYMVYLHAPLDFDDNEGFWGYVTEMSFDKGQMVWNGSNESYNAILSAVNKEDEYFVSHYRPLPEPPKEET